MLSSSPLLESLLLVGGEGEGGVGRGGGSTVLL
jgi:hypothetical protein